MQSRYDLQRNRCYVAYHITDSESEYSQHVVYDAQTNNEIASASIAPDPEFRDGFGYVELDGVRQKMATFTEADKWIQTFMKDDK
jgi:hypothetical protein